MEITYHREVWTDVEAFFEGESRGHLLVYELVGNLMEASCGD